MNIAPFALRAFEVAENLVLAVRMSSIQSSARPKLIRELDNQKVKSMCLAALMLFSTLASIEFVSYAALASTDQDGDGLTYGLEYLINTHPNDWDSDNDQLPDGWEWQYWHPHKSGKKQLRVGHGQGLKNTQKHTHIK